MARTARRPKRKKPPQAKRPAPDVRKVVPVFEFKAGEPVRFAGKPWDPADATSLHGNVSDECVAHYEAGKKFGHRAGFEEAMALKPDWSGNWLGGLMLVAAIVISAALGFAAGRWPW